MAKVKGPLMSLDARGQIAKTLVFMGWKGIQDVRKYVIPANPRTAAQQGQRGYFKDAVDAWHTDGYTSDDVAAWNLLALAIKQALSGFNAFVRHYVNAKVAAKTWTKLTNCVISGITASGATVEIDVASDQSSVLYYGTSKTALYNSVAGTFDSINLKYTFTLSGLVAGTEYFFYIANTATEEAARTGIYTFKTLAA